MGLEEHVWRFFVQTRGLFAPRNSIYFSDLDSLTVLCLIGFDDDRVIKDFIRIHAEGLAQPLVCLSGSYPDYQSQGRNIRKLYEQPGWLRRLGTLLPYAVQSRRLERFRNSHEIARRAVGRFFASRQVDVILAEFGDTGAAVAPAAHECGIPLVVHFHGHDAHRRSLLTPQMVQQYRFMFQTAAAVLVVSRYMWQTLAEMGCSHEKLIYNPYGPRERFFNVQPDYRPTVLSVGRFTDIKANYLVLMAFWKAWQQVPYAKLVMAGGGELLETCKTLAQVWNLQHAVSFTGPVEHSQVHDLFAQACCLAQHSVVPSYGDAEGTPNTILEACAAGLPVIATKHAGIPDVVVDGVTGLLVDERDVNGMAEAMVRLLQEPQLCRQMGAKGRARVQAGFTSCQHIQRLQAVIDYARQRRPIDIAALAAESLKIGL